MSGFAIGALASLGGAGLSALGAAGEGRRATQQAQSSQFTYHMRNSEAMFRLLSQLYGGKDLDDALKANTTKETYDWIKNNMTNYQGSLDFAAKQPTVLGEAQKLRDDNRTQTDSIVQGFTNQSEDVDQLYKDHVGTTQKWGQGREAIIRRDTGQMIRDADGSTQASMRSRGLGNSTLVGQATAGNRERGMRVQEDALARLSEGQVDRQLQAESERLGYRSRVLPLLTDLRMGGLQRDQQLGQAGTSLRTQMLSSPVMSPWMGMDTTRYYPQTGGGAVSSSIGSSLGAFGGYLMGGSDLPEWLTGKKSGTNN